MEKRCVTADCAPPAIGPYSHGTVVGNMLFLSGQLALASDGSGPQPGTVEDEGRLALSNAKGVLEECGSGLQHVVKVTVYLSDMNDFAEFNAVYGEFFTADCPARTCVEVARLPLDLKVEVDVIALIPE